MVNFVDDNQRSNYDPLLITIAEYTLKTTPFSKEALDTAFITLMDALGCGFLALKFSETCRSHLGPVVPGTQVPMGVRVPGTAYQLDPIKAAWDIGCMVRWLDFNDTWLAAEWGHPSDNLGALLSISDYISQRKEANNQPPLSIQTLLESMIKAYEIQGILALTNSFNRFGLDHVALVKIASTAVTTQLLGGNKNQILSALSHAFVDGQSLRTYRHAPNACPRKSWAAGDATARAVHLSLCAMKGEIGIPSVLTAKKWGFQTTLFQDHPLNLSQDLTDYVMRHILFKVQYPAEFHAQTAIEAAIHLHPQLKGRYEDIQTIRLTTHEAAIRIISKAGPLNNPADRDHCLQYMVAIGLLFGSLNETHYEDQFHASHPEIDILRNKMEVIESPQYTKNYYAENKRAIPNDIQIFFKSNPPTHKMIVEYPLGHRQRREEALPELRKKFTNNLSSCFPDSQKNSILNWFQDREAISHQSVSDLLTLLNKKQS